MNAEFCWIILVLFPLKDMWYTNIKLKQRQTLLREAFFDTKKPRKLFSFGAPPRTPLEELTMLPRPLVEWGGWHPSLSSPLSTSSLHEIDLAPSFFLPHAVTGLTTARNAPDLTHCKLKIYQRRHRNSLFVQHKFRPDNVACTTYLITKEEKKHNLPILILLWLYSSTVKNAKYCCQCYMECKVYNDSAMGIGWLFEYWRLPRRHCNDIRKMEPPTRITDGDTYAILNGASRTSVLKEATLVDSENWTN